MSNAKRIAKSKLVTKALLDGTYPELPELTDDKAKAVADLVKNKSAFGVGSAKVIDNPTKQAIAALLGIDPEYLGKRSLLNFDPFVAMVPTEDNGDLQKDKVYVLIDSRQNQYFNCSDGSVMSTRMSTSRKKVRPATPAEIDGFFAELELFNFND